MAPFWYATPTFHDPSSSWWIQSNPALRLLWITSHYTSNGLWFSDIFWWKYDVDTVWLFAGCFHVHKLNSFRMHKLRKGLWHIYVCCRKSRSFLYQPGSRKRQNHKFVLRKQVNNTPLITQKPLPLVHATKQSSMLFPWKVPQESRKARGITVISCLLHFPIVRNKHVTKMKVT